MSLDLSPVTAPAPRRPGRPAALSPAPSPYRLVSPPLAAPVVPVLDDAQRRVVEHPGGPLLVLAGPGTGKTTTLVEAVVARVVAGLRPEQVLVLTFSRRAAAELRERLTSRLGRTTGEPVAWTFHAWCFALLRAHQDPALPGRFGDPLRLLSGPQQDVVLRELLRGSVDLHRPVWPPGLRPGLGTRGMAEEVRALLARARERGLSPDDLAAVARRERRPDWWALAEFYGQYLDVLDASGSVDYGDLVSRAVALAEQPAVGQTLAQRYRAVFVDEYQDTDPAQERLLRALAGGGRDLVVVGDPDQAVYAFRGAEVDGLLRFPDRFPHADGRPADVVALRRSRRAGAALLARSRGVAQRIPAPGLPASVRREHRRLDAAPGLPPGSAVARTYPSAGAEAEAVADLLRREHLEVGTPWSAMAVLVRSGVRSIPLLRRALSAAGVPVEVAGDELPLAREPAVAPLLMGLRVAADPEALTPEVARRLLTSPLCGADGSALRRLGRALRESEAAALRSDPEATSHLPRPSARLLREAVADPRLLVDLPERVAWPAQRLGDLLRAARAVLDGDEGPEAALWTLWSGSGWASRLERVSAAGGPGGRSSDRDLDAVVALFSAVARASEQRRQVAGVQPLLDELEAQQIPGDTLDERTVSGPAVRLLTAHRSKGLEWDVVVVCGVQEGLWPDLRRRYSLLEPDRLDVSSADGLREPPGRADLLADERRLFYVAVTRARRRLVVTAVASPEEDGERPSRFLDELGLAVEPVLQRVGRPLSLPALVSALRRATADPAASDSLRRAAAVRLAQLAALRDPAGTALAPAADPDRWWGVLEPTRSDVPVHPADVPVRLSGTSLTGLGECPLRWFLDHEVHAQQPSSTAMGFGGVVHALAHEVARGRTAADAAALDERLSRVWGQLAYEAPWQSALQREVARQALGRFLTWQSGRPDRRLVGSEVPFEVEVALPAGRALLRGSVDRVEVDADGHLHIADLKTGRSPGPKAALKHPQLGVYQLAARAGALDGTLAAGGAPTPASLGGAELVQLRDDDDAGGPCVLPQPPLASEGSTFVEDLLDRAVSTVLTETFPATPNDHCARCPFRSCCPAQPEGRQVVA